MILISKIFIISLIVFVVLMGILLVMYLLISDHNM